MRSQAAGTGGLRRDLFVLFGVFSIELYVVKGRGFFPQIASPAACCCYFPARVVSGGGGMLIHEMWSRLSAAHLAAHLRRVPSPPPRTVRDLGGNGKMKHFAGEHGVRRSRWSAWHRAVCIRTPAQGCLGHACVRTHTVHTQPHSHPSVLCLYQSPGSAVHGRQCLRLCLRADLWHAT